MPLPALHVLLVEDIELNVIVARSVLEKLGNSVDVAMTGKAALEMFAPGRIRFGLTGYSATGYDGPGHRQRTDPSPHAGRSAAVSGAHGERSER
ncbi:aerobic respiration control sensor protein ArcB [Salmonella enterica subsp. arizonae]|uniref:Aerobic respiration control sensor protein ArcB n=1 Tax=Salmonella enterica subsp. arizonae TaxID=59203 RepID=A0A379T7S8_SALER|nr:aerobic respiration control sensor protein ArcB [Salmonella enterica subsp. arizonae]